MSQYFLPNGHARVSIDVKKSDFHAYATEVRDKESAVNVLKAEKQRYPSARHHCWAYIIGQPMQPEHASMSDDGEPSGTAGKPILNIIQHHNIGNTIIVVSRYFGGIKLGAGGLIRAYANAAKQVLTQLPTTSFVPLSEVYAVMEFNKEHNFRHIVTGLSGEIGHTRYTDKLTIKATIPQNKLKALLQKCAGLGISVDQGG
ncbi:YigZ family protein [Alteromonas sediminis]|uniref:YigZ family protein n=2 Tax=Alteromonas sediminis TaxID=2259342 RepID=A0A3N5Y1S6_9ALTE|nr:YigZ family protein [Alteromonas sediminis]